MSYRWCAFFVCAWSVGLMLVGCGGSQTAALGEECDPDAETPCESDAACLASDGDEDYQCYQPAGESCDPEADEHHCEPDAGCSEVESGDDEETVGECRMQEGGTCESGEDLCAPELTCEAVQDSEDACHRPVYVDGMVVDAGDDSPIEGAHIIGLDDKKVAATDVAVSDEEGDYRLILPTERQEGGEPIDSSFTLRADAADYQTFPGGLRTALPVNTSTAEEVDEGWIIEGAPTTIALIELEADERDQHTISGRVLADDPAGVLVVAEPADFEAGSEDEAVAFSAIADREGDYTIFNVPDGEYDVRGYAGGVHIEPEEVAVEGTSLEEIDLSESDEGLPDVSGSVEIVNAPGDAATSVVLVVASTFDDTFVRGEVPAGLRDPETGQPDVTGNWQIEQVPPGEYVVLAAFENDGMVRDPDQNIGGTDFVLLEVEAGSDDVQVGDSFKVTEALAVEGPGAEEPEQLESAPTLRWADDSSEDFYEVEVYNAYGDLVWEDRNIDSVSGSDTVDVEYDGPTEQGMYYQFRASSWRAPGGQDASAISQTEDLRGVFFFE